MYNKFVLGNVFKDIRGDVFELDVDFCFLFVESFFCFYDERYIILFFVFDVGN